MVDITQYCGGVCELIPPGYHLAMMPIQWVNSASASGVRQTYRPLRTVKKCHFHSLRSDIVTAIFGAHRVRTS
jgi:hypothetical protein